MAAILSVTYTPQYQGCHRIAFRTIPDATYCIYQDNTASEIGVPKTIDITLDDYLDCLQQLPVQQGCGTGTDLQGYVQPCCSDANTFANSVAFTVSYPAPTSCSSYTVECQESGIAVISVIDPGYGYAVGEVPSISIADIGGVGIGAVATPNMVCDDSLQCSVSSITIDLTGQYYYDAAQISVTIDPPVSGTQATAEVTALNECGTFMIPNCSGSDNGIVYKIIQAQGGIKFCSGGDGPSAPKYIVTPDTTSVCCNCTEIQIVSRVDVDIYYTDCNQTIQTLSIVGGFPGTTVCGIPGSIFTVNSTDYSYIFNITEVGPCTP